MRAAYEAQQAAALKRSSGAPGQAASDGRRLVANIYRRYGLNPEYSKPDTFGPRMVVWLPTAAWRKLSTLERSSIEAYMSANYANWGIGVGRVSGRQVLYDELVVEH